MWPYSETEARWLSGENIRIEDITPEMIEADLRAARKLRAELIAGFARAIPGIVADALKSPRHRSAGKMPGHGQTT